MSFGTSSTDKTTNYNQTTQSTPWAPAIPYLTGLLGKAGSAPTDVTPAQTAAFGQLQSNYQQGDPNAGAYRNLSTNLLNSPSETAPIQSGWNQLQNTLTPIAQGSVDPLQNSYMQHMLKFVGDDVQNRVNSQFAAAGRDSSAYNQRAVSYGLGQAEAPLLLGQYNQNVQNQMGAASSLMSGGAATTAGMGNSDALTAQLRAAGINVGNAALDAQNYGPKGVIQTGQQQTQLPFQNLGYLASLLYPGAQLGGTQNTQGTANTQGSTDSFGFALKDLSDERAKEDIQQVGKLADGTPVHKFRYKADPLHHVRLGIMAQEVEKRTPDAVSNDGPMGLKLVNIDHATAKAADIVRKRRSAYKEAA